MLHRIAALSLLASLVACGTESSPPPPWGDGSAAADDPSAPGLADTSAKTLALHQGYNRLLDLGGKSCVEPASVDESVGDVEEQFDVTLINTREQLAEKLGIDIGVKFKYILVNADADVGLVNTFTESTSSVNLLMRIRQGYGVLNEAPVTLTDEALALLNSDPDTFLLRCGNLYAKGLRYRAQMHMLIRFDASDETTAQNIKAMLGLGVNVPIPVGGSVGVNMEKAASMAGVTVGINVSSEGFLLNGTPASGAVVASFINGAVTGETFTKLDEIRNAMSTSILGDMCRDGGGSDCGGPSANTRFARLSKVLLAPYVSADNSPLPSASWDGYGQMANQLSAANSYLRELGRVQSDLEAAYLDELQPFLSSAQSGAIRFGIAPPAAPVYTLDELTQAATTHADEFRPSSGGSAGSLNQPISDRLAGCWNGANSGTLRNCHPPDGMPIAELPEIKTATAALETYKTTARILPLRYRISSLVLGPDAPAACAALRDAANQPMRLATWDEAQRLAVVVSNGTFTRSMAFPYDAWAENSTQTCTLTSQRRSLRNMPSGQHAAYCRDYDVTLPALCVPASGPFPAN
ncbi:MAG: hypothetical protein AB7P03_21465 [Kofleriaceae bacterium]